MKLRSILLPLIIACMLSACGLNDMTETTYNETSDTTSTIIPDENGTKPIQQPEIYSIDGMELIVFPRTVRVGNTWLDNNSNTIAYEEKEAGSCGIDFNRKAVFVTTNVIKDYYDSKMKCSDGVYTFKLDNLDVTLTKDYISAYNDLFGEVYREENIKCIVRDNDMLVEIGHLMDLLSISTNGIKRLNEDDKFMVAAEIGFFPNEKGNVNIGELDKNEYNYYTGAIVKKPKDYERIAINPRGHYICKDINGTYVLEADGKFYEIEEEMVGAYDDEI